MAGTVMKGPVPTMFDILMETAFSNPNLRAKPPGWWFDGDAAMLVSALKGEAMPPKIPSWYPGLLN
jgi:hypothetical protein